MLSSNAALEGHSGRPGMHTPDLPTVLLKHTLPDGTAHFDWMYAPDASADTKLTSFRIAEPIHHPEIDSFDAEMIGAHRREYLTYQGPVSGNRGSVERVASGKIRVDEQSDACIRVRVAWPSGSKAWVGSPIAGNVWRFVIDALPGR